MPQVEFHILSQAGDEARLRHACTLVEEAQKQNQQVFVCCDDSTLRRLDELLWTFHDHAFIPHEVMQVGSSPHPRTVALLGAAESLPDGFSVVINLRDELPAQLEQATRIHEVVDAEPLRKQQARDRYKQYRDRGCTLATTNH